jgi:hypothetical protein
VTPRLAEKQFPSRRSAATSVFGNGAEVGDVLPSGHYAERLKQVPKAWEKTFEVNPSDSEAVRASCVEFVLAGLYASDRISRSQKHGRITYEVRRAFHLGQGAGARGVAFQRRRVLSVLELMMRMPSGLMATPVIPPG